MSAFWFDVVATPKDGVMEGGTAKVNASLRLWTASGDHKQVKGIVTLQRFSLGMPLFRIHYNGKIIDQGSEAARASVGMIYLPVVAAGPPIITREKLESKHTKALGIRITFADNDDGIQAVQLVIPFNSLKSAQNRAYLMAEAIEFAESDISPHEIIN